MDRLRRSRGGGQAPYECCVDAARAWIVAPVIWFLLVLLTVIGGAAAIAGYAHEVLVIGDVRCALEKRGAATCAMHGHLGPLGALKKDRPDGHVERARWWLYSAPGDDTLLLEQWGSDYRVLRGKKVGE